MCFSDITYLRTREGWLYLCAVRDGCSRRVLGWAMDSVQNTDLVERALRGDLPADVVFHADRGAQFTSTQLWEASQELGVLQSVGRTGVCCRTARNGTSIPVTGYRAILTTWYFNSC